jgi:hypothetical protein
VSPAKGYERNTSLALGHPLVANRVVPYEIRNAPNVKASLIKKYHIISLPYSTLKGLRPPFHILGVVAVVAIYSNCIVAKLLAKAQKKRITKNFFFTYSHLRNMNR